MRAEDVINEAGRMRFEHTDQTFAEVLVAHGIAYDEMARVMTLGPFFAQQDERPGEDEFTAMARLWMDGFLVGLRMGRNDRPTR